MAGPMHKRLSPAFFYITLCLSLLLTHTFAHPLSAPRNTLSARAPGDTDVRKMYKTFVGLRIEGDIHEDKLVFYRGRSSVSAGINYDHPDAQGERDADRMVFRNDGFHSVKTVMHYPQVRAALGVDPDINVDDIPSETMAVAEAALVDIASGKARVYHTPDVVDLVYDHVTSPALTAALKSHRLQSTLLMKPGSLDPNAFVGSQDENHLSPVIPDSPPSESDSDPVSFRTATKSLIKSFNRVVERLAPYKLEPGRFYALEPWSPEFDQVAYKTTGNVVRYQGGTRFTIVWDGIKLDVPVPVQFGGDAPDGFVDPEPQRKARKAKPLSKSREQKILTGTVKPTSKGWFRRYLSAASAYLKSLPSSMLRGVNKAASATAAKLKPKPKSQSVKTSAAPEGPKPNTAPAAPSHDRPVMDRPHPLRGSSGPKVSAPKVQPLARPPR